jgi:tRNA 2-thiocytidine biosynthesis protein TtcA
VDLERKLAKQLGRAVVDFSMIEEGDRILCAVSGGKDSYAMHALLVDLAKRAPVRFEVFALNVDQGHPGYPGHVLRDYMREQGHAFEMIADDTYSIVTAKIPAGKTYCSLCSRLRRAILYRAARERGCTKIALGHHRDDVVTTLLLNLVFGGQLKAMPPKLKSDDGDNVVIRPLVYCSEADLAAYAVQRAFPILPCDLCGSQENLQRKQMSKLLEDLEARVPGVRQNMLAALGNVRPTHLLDKELWTRLGIDHARDDGEPGARGERAADRTTPSVDVALSQLVRGGA